MSLLIRGAALAALVLLVLSPARPGEATPARRVSSAQEREQVTLTVYNQNFGLVRELRRVQVGKGTVELEFADVAAGIQPETVHILPRDNAEALRVLEQNYQYDLLNPQKLLEKYVGRQVKIYRWNETVGRDEEYEAEVLAVNGGTILKIGDEITFNFPGRIAFPKIPENLIAAPTLLWLLESREDRQTLEVSYLTQHLNWKADYVMVIDEADAKAALTGWVTLTNQSGASYENARLKLVAGDVQRVQEQPPDHRRLEVMMRAAEAAPQFREEGFFEYHLYTLERETTLRDNEQKQVTLLEASEVGVAKRLVFRGEPQWFRGVLPQPRRNQKVSVYLELENKKANQLGLPLPKGIVRVYKADSEGAQQFIGEDRIDHTPRDETFRIKTGEAFDVVADRRQLDYDVVSQCVSESAWEIELRNHKDTDERVEVVEPASGDWEILRSSHPVEKEDAHSFRFEVEVPGRGSARINYRVRVRWC